MCPTSLSPASIATAPLRRTLWLCGATRQSQRTPPHAPQSHLSVPLVSHRGTVTGLGDEAADAVGLSCTSRTRRSDRPSLSCTRRGLSKWQHIATVHRPPTGLIHSANSPCATRVSARSQAASPPSQSLTFACGPLVLHPAKAWQRDLQAGGPQDHTRGRVHCACGGGKAGTFSPG